MLAKWDNLMKLIPSHKFFAEAYSSKLGEHIFQQTNDCIIAAKCPKSPAAATMLGYCSPYLENFNYARNLISLSHHKMGLQPLKNIDGKNISCAFAGNILPIKTESQELIFVAHFLEYMENMAEMMQEISRITVPSGKLLMILPSYVSNLWQDYYDEFGFSRVQIEELFENSDFEILHLTNYIFKGNRSGSKIFSPLLEFISRKFAISLGSYWFVVATKHKFVSGDVGLAEVNNGMMGVNPALI